VIWVINLRSFQVYGGDDGARTRDLCCDRSAFDRNPLKLWALMANKSTKAVENRDRNSFSTLLSTLAILLETFAVQRQQACSTERYRFNGARALLGPLSVMLRPSVSEKRGQRRDRTADVGLFRAPLPMDLSGLESAYVIETKDVRAAPI
jgi:hypothetical protein